MAILDLRYYSGEDLYSDGDVEDRIIDYISNYPSENYDEVFLKDKDLSVFYHLSDTRTALLNWYDFDPGASVLEIGAGMGALTGLLCDRCESVVSVELSLRRASAIEKRCYDKDNLTIMVGDFSDMVFERKFDYITVIGTLEHQTAINDQKNAQYTFLKKVVSLLAPEGKLLLAIENRFGLKYWCGELDDHTGIPFGSISQHHYKGKARTLDRHGLAQLLYRVGMINQKFFYPMPDYKFPRVIYSDNSIPESELHSCVKPIYYSNYYGYKSNILDERKLYRPILENGVFPFFANSFLVEAGAEQTAMSGIDFASVTVEREKQYRQIIRMIDGRFEKYAANAEGYEHIRHAHHNLEELRKHGLCTIEQDLVDGKIRMKPYYEQTVEKMLIDLVADGKTEEAIACIDRFYGLILLSSDQISDECNQIYDTCFVRKDSGLKFGPILERAYGDMIFSNCFCKGEEWLFYDQEWVFDALPAGYILYIAIKVLYTSFPWMDEILPHKALLRRYSISDELCVIYDNTEEYLYRDIQSDAICSVIGFLRSQDDSTLENNVNLLMNGHQTIHQLETRVGQAEEIICEKDRQIAGREEIIREKDGQIAGREEIIREKDGQIAGREEIIREKDGQIAGREEIICEKDRQIAARDEVIAEKDRQITELEKKSRRKVFFIR